jgi:hypothetical protein
MRVSVPPPPPPVSLHGVFNNFTFLPSLSSSLLKHRLKKLFLGRHEERTERWEWLERLI